MTPSLDAPDVGAVLAGRYELVRFIASGGMSDVYEATDRVLGRQAAVKVYRATAVPDRRRFEAEVRILAALSHPGLVHLYDAGEHDGDEFVVLELIDGPTLAAVLADEGPLAEGDLRRMAEAVAEALAHVHAAGVVHRDVTPANILCGLDGRARLADFGIARLLDTSRVTAVAHTVGTVAYMSPEQVEGRDVTSAADVYALGLVLLEALTGRCGFTGVGHEVALARLARDPDVSTGVSEVWRPLLRDMTQRDPLARPSAKEVHDRLVGLPMDKQRKLAVGSAFVGTDAAASALTRTQVVPVTHGATVIMPLRERPDTVPTSAFGRSDGEGPAGRRRALAITAGVLVAVLALAFATSRDNPSPFGEPQAPVTASSSVPGTGPTTTVGSAAPPVTSAPLAPAGAPKGKGKGHGG